MCVLVRGQKSTFLSSYQAVGQKRNPTRTYFAHWIGCSHCSLVRPSATMWTCGMPGATSAWLVQLAAILSSFVLHLNLWVTNLRKSVPLDHSPVTTHMNRIQQYFPAFLSPDTAYCTLSALIVDLTCPREQCGQIYWNQELSLELFPPVNHIHCGNSCLHQQTWANPAWIRGWKESNERHGAERLHPSQVKRFRAAFNHKEGAYVEAIEQDASS